ncbi:MAG TPA: hypothetical protein VF131_23120 [Blastocatellia bacterium]|nr:hypothetical protein [Blastocatellia bacterium]
MMTFDELMMKWICKPIRNCPGRYIIYSAPANLSPEYLLGPAAELRLFRVAATEDAVVVARLDKGGLISYSRTDGTYLHTLNTAEGFERKLSNLEVEMETE